jgi:hypothetical protein
MRVAVKGGQKIDIFRFFCRPLMIPAKPARFSRFQTKEKPIGPVKPTEE